MKQELSDRPSCSFAGQMSVKQEAVSPELGLPMVGKLLSGSLNNNLVFRLC